MKVINVRGGTIESSYVKMMGGLEEQFLKLNGKLKPNFSVIYSNEPINKREVVLFEKEMNKDNESLIILSNSYLQYIKEYIELILQEKKKDKNLIVHVHFSPLSNITIPITRILGVKNIYWTKHSKMMKEKYTKSWFISKITGFFVKHIICVSNAVEKEAQELNLDYNRTTVIPLGVNIDRYSNLIPKEKKMNIQSELKINPDDFVITIVAQQRPEKKVEIFIKAFASFIKNNKIDNAVGLILGGGPLQDENIQLAKDLEIYDSLRFTGTRSDVDIVYSVSNIAGLTSETEALGLALLEACASSLALFGSNVGGIPEVIKEGYNGFLFEAADYEALSEIFKKYYFDKNLREEFGKNSFKYVLENYEMNNCCDRLISHYKECVN